MAMLVVGMFIGAFIGVLVVGICQMAKDPPEPDEWRDTETRGNGGSRKGAKNAKNKDGGAWAKTKNGIAV